MSSAALERELVWIDVSGSARTMGAEIAWGVLRRLPGAPGNALYPKLLPLCAAAVYIGRNPQRHPLYDGSADVLQLTNDFVSSVHCERKGTTLSTPR